MRLRPLALMGYACLEDPPNFQPGRMNQSSEGVLVTGYEFHNYNCQACVSNGVSKPITSDALDKLSTEDRRLWTELWGQAESLCMRYLECGEHYFSTTTELDNPLFSNPLSRTGWFDMLVKADRNILDVENGHRNATTLLENAAVYLKMQADKTAALEKAESERKAEGGDQRPEPEARLLREQWLSDLSSLEAFKHRRLVFPSRGNEDSVEECGGVASNGQELMPLSTQGQFIRWSDRLVPLEDFLARNNSRPLLRNDNDWFDEALAHNDNANNESVAESGNGEGRNEDAEE